MTPTKEQIEAAMHWLAEHDLTPHDQYMSGILLDALRERDEQLKTVRAELAQSILTYIIEQCATSADTWIVEPGELIDSIRALAQEK